MRQALQNDISGYLLRRGMPSDAGQLSQLAIKAFCETFSHYDEAERMKFLSTYYCAEKFLAELQQPESHFWIVADGEEFIAYMNVGPVTLPYKSKYERTVQLSRLYVLNSHKRQGIGQQLMARVLDYAIAEKADAIILGVWENNILAQNFYDQCGFKVVGEYFYPPIGKFVDRELIMCKELPSFRNEKHE